MLTLKFRKMEDGCQEAGRTLYIFLLCWLCVVLEYQSTFVAKVFVDFAKWSDRFRCLMRAYLPRDKAIRLCSAARRNCPLPIRLQSCKSDVHTTFESRLPRLFARTSLSEARNVDCGFVGPLLLLKRSSCGVGRPFCSVHVL